jgi:hypothetical protein
MDQLKVILEHRFWVLTALAVLIPPMGWWLSIGDMATKTESRTKAINLKVKAINDLSKDLSRAANPDWIKGATDVNIKLAARVDETQKRLFEHQRPAMVWHPLVKKELDASQVKYRGGESVPAPNPQAFLRAKQRFMSRYADMWRSDVYQVVEPFDVVTADRGKVLCSNQDGAPQITRAPAELWLQRQMVSTQEMWDAQEDLWLLHALMKAIAQVNDGSRSIDDAQIKRLMSCTLRGGSAADLADRHKKKQTSAPTGQGGQPAASPGGGFGLRSLSPSRSDADTGPKPLPLIDPDDIFGSEGEVGSTMGGGGKKQGAGEAAVALRYVEEGPRWHARGFVLRLVMNHQEIPKLLTLLTEAPFPVQIWHVEHQWHQFQRNRQPTLVTTENEAETKRVKVNEERLNLAMNQVNLAEVLVAGTFILYDEPGAPAGQPTASPGAAPAAPAAAAKASPPGKTTNGTPAATTGAKPAAPGSSAPGTGPATKNPGPGKTATPGAPTAPQSPKGVPPSALAPGSSTPKAAQPAKAKS